MKNKNLYYSCIFLLIATFYNSCSVNKAQIDNEIKSYFDSEKVEGCFTMLNNADGNIIVYNLNLDTTRFLPGSTFDILTALISLETGLIADEQQQINYSISSNTDTNQSQHLSLKEAFNLNAASFNNFLIKNIGKDTLKNWIDSIAYGNKKIIGSLDSIAVNNQLKISPDEQLGLTKRLYFDQLPFRKSVQNTVRQLMLKEDNNIYKLSIKTGNGVDEKNNKIGWALGWVEENRHVYFFTTLIKSKNEMTDVSQKVEKISRDILTHYNFFKGLK
jgi:beta-lactamase class D